MKKGAQMRTVMGINGGSAMKYLFFSIVGALLSQGMAIGQEHRHEDEAKGEHGKVKVYLADHDKKVVDLSDVTLTLMLEVKGLGRKVLKLSRVKAEGDDPPKNAVDHGGEVREMKGGYHVELLVEKPHPGHGKEENHKEHEASDVAHFEVELELEVYGCPMKCEVKEKAGKCSKCGMSLKAQPREFTAVAIFRISGKPLNVKGFEYPPAVPKTYPAAVEKAEKHLAEIKSLIDSNRLSKVHAVAEKISHICRKLPGMAPKDDLAEIQKVCKEIVGLFGEIDTAADGGNKSATLKAYEKYKAKIALLKKHATHEHHDD